MGKWRRCADVMMHEEITFGNLEIKQSVVQHRRMKPPLKTPAPDIRCILPSDVNPDDVLLLDVRTPAEFEKAHIEGAVLQPLAILDAGTTAKLGAGKSACVVICQSGRRSEQAAEKLAASGHTALRILDGGVRAWESAGLPLVRGRGTVSLERQVRIAAGSLVFAGAALGYFVHPAWIALSAFVGAGLVFAGLTDSCGMALLLARMPWNKR